MSRARKYVAPDFRSCKCKVIPTPNVDIIQRTSTIVLLPDIHQGNKLICGLGRSAPLFEIAVRCQNSFCSQVRAPFRLNLFLSSKLRHHEDRKALQFGLCEACIWDQYVYSSLESELYDIRNANSGSQHRGISRVSSQHDPSHKPNATVEHFPHT